MADRQYLIVPYTEREAAKAVGARWDVRVKSWWVSSRVARTSIERWLPDRAPPRQVLLTETEVRRQFADAMRGLGLTVSGEHPIMDGETHRVPVDDDRRGRASGQYVGYLDGRPAGHIKNYKSGLDINWKSDGQFETVGEPMQARAEAAERHRERGEARQAVFEATAARVVRQTKELRHLTTPTPYMIAKCIEPSIGALCNRDTRTLYLPAIDVHGMQWTMQYIRADGSKRFAKDSRKEGCFHIVGGDLAVLSATAVLIVGEGYATMNVVSDVARMPTIVAFDSGNLAAVVEALRGRFPDKPILITGDDDRRVELEKGFNPGRDKASDAAASVGGVAILPLFARGEQESDPGGFTDFNDLAMRSRLGRKGVERQVVAGIKAAIAKLVDERLMARTPVQAHAAPTGRKAYGGR